MRVGRYPEALDAFEDTLDIYKEVYEKNAVEFIDVYLSLADAERYTDYLSDWTKHNRDALGIAREVMGKESAAYAFLLLEVGHTEFVNQGSEGEGRIEEGYKILRDMTPEPAQMGFAHFLKGKVAMSHKRYEDALPYLKASVQKINADPATIDYKLLLTALGFITVALEETGQSDLATESLTEIGLIKEKLGDDSVVPIFKIEPRFPNNVDTMTTGTLLNVKKLNEGKVTIQFDVDEKGFTTNHSVFLSTGKQSYADAAMDAVKKYRFAPRFVNGQPVTVAGAQQSFSFLLDL
jgi:TonB family protein